MSAAGQLLVRYGKLGILGRCETPVAVSRGGVVIVRTPRGVEAAEVLVIGHAVALPGADCAFLRLADVADHAAIAAAEKRAAALLHELAATPAPWWVVDVECTLDGGVIVHVLPSEQPPAAEQTESWLADWERRTATPWRLLPLAVLASSSSPAVTPSDPATPSPDTSYDAATGCGHCCSGDGARGRTGENGCGSASRGCGNPHSGSPHCSSPHCGNPHSGSPHCSSPHCSSHSRGHPHCGHHDRGQDGCGTSACARRHFRRPDDLAAYFAQLRQQMERRHSLL